MSEDRLGGSMVARDSATRCTGLLDRMGDIRNRKPHPPTFLISAEAVAAGVSGAFYWDQIGPELLSVIDRLALSISSNRCPPVPELISVDDVLVAEILSLRTALCLGLDPGSRQCAHSAGRTRTTGESQSPGCRISVGPAA